MEKTSSLEQYFFPTKQQMLGKVNLKPIEVVSNHFKVSFSNKTSFDEWHMRFIRLEDKAQAEVTPDVLKDSVAPDARAHIQEIVSRNKKLMISTIGGCFHTGVTLFSFSEKANVKDRYIFDQHDKHLLFIERKHKNVDFKNIQFSANSGVRMQMIRFLNSFVKNCLKNLNYYPWGRNLKYYNLDDYSCVEQHNLTIFKGYATSVDVYEGGLKMMVDYSTRIIRDHNLMDELIYYEVDVKNKDAVLEYVVGKSYMANYGNNRIYRVDDVAFDLKITSPFPDQGYSNYEDYFVRRYKIPKLKYRDQFLCVHKAKRFELNEKKEEVVKYDIIYLVPELILPTGLTDQMRSDFRVMKDLGAHTIVKPDKRLPMIQGFAEKINKQADLNKDFNFKIDAKSNKITGYSLRPPKVLTGSQGVAIKGDSINLEKVNKAKDLDNWVLFYDFKSKRDVNTVIDQLKDSSKRFGIKVNSPNDIIELPKNVNEKDFENMIKSSKKAGQPNILFFLCTKMTAKSLYRKAKKFYQRKGISSQFFVSFNPNKDIGNMAKFGKIVTQMVDKLGGKLWEVEINLPETIIAGADVCHLPKNKSVASLVATYGKNFESFFSCVKIQPKGVEIMKNLASMVLEAVKAYKQDNKKPPKQILFYRDGVGEGQLEEVKKFEIIKIKETLIKEYGNEAPQLLFVVVTKRISDRFAIQTDRGLSNPVGGLYIREDVVKADRANFYLVAQKVTQGTASPTHYEVIYNDTQMKFDDLAELTYQLTFSYTNWTGAVKVPGVVQYAHKQASVIAVTQDDVVDSHLMKTKFYM